MNVKAVAFCALLMMASPAAAQWGPYGPRGPGFDAVSLHEIHATLRANGLRPVTRPVLSWPYVVIRAADSYGDVVRVLLNARYGNIVSVIPLPPAPIVGERPYGPYGHPYPPYGPRYSDVRPDLKTEPAPPVGPNVIYGGPPAQEPRAAAAIPARPPMPRPRPPAATATARAEVVAPAGGAPAAAAPAAEPTAAAPPATTAETAAPSKPAFPPAAPLE